MNDRETPKVFFVTHRIPLFSYHEERRDDFDENLGPGSQRSWGEYAYSHLDCIIWMSIFERAATGPLYYPQ